MNIDKEIMLRKKTEKVEPTKIVTAKQIGMQNAEPYRGIGYFLQRTERGWRAFNYGECPLETQDYSGKGGKQKAIDDIKSQIDGELEK